MNNMYPMVLFLIVFTITSSSVCVSSNNDDDQEILMVVEDQPTMHDIDAGIGMTKVNPVQLGKFLLNDGKELTLSRKSSPSKNCVNQGESCGVGYTCCDGLACDGVLWGTCNSCVAAQQPCSRTVPCCSPYTCRNFRPTLAACL